MTRAHAIRLLTAKLLENLIETELLDHVEDALEMGPETEELQMHEVLEDETVENCTVLVRVELNKVIAQLRK